MRVNRSIDVSYKLLSIIIELISVNIYMGICVSTRIYLFTDA